MQTLTAEKQFKEDEHQIAISLIKTKCKGLDEDELMKKISIELESLFTEL